MQTQTPPKAVPFPSRPEDPGAHLAVGVRLTAGAEASRPPKPHALSCTRGGCGVYGPQGDCNQCSGGARLESAESGS